MSSTLFNLKLKRKNTTPSSEITPDDFLTLYTILCEGENASEEQNVSFSRFFPRNYLIYHECKLPILADVNTLHEVDMKELYNEFRYENSNILKKWKSNEIN
jgi:hypothetical protein